MRGTRRRDVLRGALGAGLAAPFVRIASSARAQTWARNPFTLGVASGDPAPDGFVIWTRLALDPLLARGGMRPTPVPVGWEVAANETMSAIVRSGEFTARVELGHSVHVEVDGLEPAREYFFRFRAGDAESPIGRVRTLPAPGAALARLRFVAAGCQHWEGGFFTAWKRVAEEAPDFVFHYGDYKIGRAHV